MGHLRKSRNHQVGSEVWPASVTPHADADAERPVALFNIPQCGPRNRHKRTREGVAPQSDDALTATESTLQGGQDTLSNSRLAKVVRHAAWWGGLQSQHYAQEKGCHSLPINTSEATESRNLEPGCHQGTSKAKRASIAPDALQHYRARAQGEVEEALEGKVETNFGAFPGLRQSWSGRVEFLVEVRREGLAKVRIDSTQAIPEASQRQPLTIEEVSEPEGRGALESDNPRVVYSDSGAIRRRRGRVPHYFEMAQDVIALAVLSARDPRVAQKRRCTMGTY